MPATVPLAPQDAAIEDGRTAVLEPEPALPLRNDTILGVCEAIGQEFGFNPLYLRLVFAGLFYFNPLMVIGTYLALGVGVAVARWLYPVATADVAQLAEHQAALAGENEDSESRLAA